MGQNCFHLPKVDYNMLKQEYVTNAFRIPKGDLTPSEWRGRRSGLGEAGIRRWWEGMGGVEGGGNSGLCLHHV